MTVPPDYDALRLWFDIFWKAATGVGIFWLWLRSGTDRNSDKIFEIEQEQQAQARRVAVMEERLHHIPTHEDLDRLHDRISKVGDSLSDLRATAARLLEAANAQGHAIDRIQDHLMERER